MISEDTNILEFNQYQKLDKVPFIIYADLECLIERMDGCKNNSKSSSTTKVGEHVFSIRFFSDQTFQCLWLSFYHKTAEKFKKQFTYLGENTEKYITFTVLKEEGYNNW